MRRRLWLMLSVLALESALAGVSGCASRRSGPSPLDTGAGPIIGAKGTGKFAEVELHGATPAPAGLETPSAAATPGSVVLAEQTGPPLEYAGAQQPAAPVTPSRSLVSRAGQAIAAVPVAMGRAALFPVRKLVGAEPVPAPTVSQEEPVPEEHKASPILAFTENTIGNVVTAPYHAVRYAFRSVFSGRENATPKQPTLSASASPAATPGATTVAQAGGDTDHKAPPSALRKAVTYPVALAWNQVSTAWKTEEGYDQSLNSPSGEVVDPTTGIKGHEIILGADPKATPKGFIQETEKVIGTTTNDTERTIFLPLKLFDEFIGLLFSPF